MPDCLEALKICLRLRTYRGPCAGCQQVLRPASGAFVRGHVADWSKVPWIWGAYSYPTLGAHPGDR